MKKILFLDVDGVLNDSFSRKIKHNAMRPSHVRNLEKILRETGCEIVLSSSWRSFGMGLDDPFFKALKRASTDTDELWDGPPNLDRFNYLKERVIDYTPLSLSYNNRGRQIGLWLEDNDPCIFVIVDDYSDMFPFMHRLVMTKDDLGLDEEKTQDIIKLFNISKLEDCAKDDKNMNTIAFGKRIR